MNESRKPAAQTGIRLLAMVLSLMLAAPVLAATTATKTGAKASKTATAKAKGERPRALKKAPAAAKAVTVGKAAAVPAPPAQVGQPPAQAAALAPTPALPPAAAVVMPAAAALPPAPPQAVAVAPVAIAAPAAATAAPAAPRVNPYLAGWYRPIPAAAVPTAAVAQINYNARYVSDSVTSIPARLADALPSIKTVHPTGGRDLVVANLRCPVEMMTGQYMLPANAMREGVNGLFNRLNESQLLKFDIQLVCS